MKLTSLLRATLGTLALAAAAHASAGPILLVSNGILTGAQGVEVQGALYNVTFAQGTCASVFGGCDTQSDFAFRTRADAVAGGRALFDQVFVDGAQGNFDSSPANTFGCTNPATCYTLIPYLIAEMSFSAAYTSNLQNNAGDVIASISRPYTFNTTNNPSYNFAKFELANEPRAVPEPGSLALIGLGMAGLALSRRRKA